MTPPPILNELKENLDSIRMRFSRLAGKRDEKKSRAVELHTSVGNAKGRRSLAPEISEVLQQLQINAHVRAVGAFENLLTAILQDVLPEKGNVELSLEMRNNAPALDIFVMNGTKREDVLESNGGAVTNVISTGLRFAALSRTANRRLMVLDEPDCWVAPERVGAFVNVLAEVSLQTNTQTFFVSHHPSDLFENKVNVVNLSVELEESEDGTSFIPVTKAKLWGEAITTWGSDDEPGLREIEVFNVGKHVHARIPCYPGATAFTGKNDLGKSTLILRALSAVAYGESSDTIINHDASTSKIVLRYEKGRRIEWTRDPSRNPVVEYELYDGTSDTPIRKGRPPSKGTVPDWVQNELGISKVDDLDIQLLNQKTPIFLLNESAGRRAQLLSVGRESGHLRELMQKYEQLKRKDQDTIRVQEIELSKINHVLKYAEKLEEVESFIKHALTLLNPIAEVNSQATQLSSLVAQLSDADKRLNAATALCSVLSSVPKTPELEDLREMQHLLDKYELAARRSIPKIEWRTVMEPVLEDTSKLLSGLKRLEQLNAKTVQVVLPDVPHLPELTDTVMLVTLGKRITEIGKKTVGLDTLKWISLTVPGLFDTSNMLQTIQKLENVSKLVNAAVEDFDKVSVALSQAEQHFNLLVENVGGICPLCDSPLNLQGHGHAN